MKIKSNYYRYLFCCLFAVSIFCCESNVLDNPKETSNIIENGHNPFLRTAKLNELKELDSYLASIKSNNNSMARTTLEDNNDFSVLEEEDISIYSEDGTTTYTIAIVKNNQNVNTISNLVVQFNEVEDTHAFIINYEPTQEFLLAKTTDPLTPYQGIAIYEPLEYDGSFDDLNARSGCYSMTFTFCNWSENGIGPTHTAGLECTPSYMWNQTVLFCPGPNGEYNEVISAPEGPSSGGGGGNVSSGNSNFGSTSNPTISINIKLKTILGMNNLTPEIAAWIDNPTNGFFKVMPLVYFAEENKDVNGNISEETLDIMLELIETMIDNSNDSIEDAIWENSILYPEEVSSGDEITNMTEYLECFDLTQPAKITIYVDQPKANDPKPYRVTYNPLDLIDVGHTFIAIEQGGIRRVLGYYPIPGTINPSSDPSENVISCQSLFRDDSGHDFHVSIEKDMTSTELTNVYNTITGANSTYNLNTNNCTDFGIDAATSSGMTLPDTNGTWPRGGNGSNPGNLGQDIRNMTTPTGVTKNTTGGLPVSNTGSCS